MSYFRNLDNILTFANDMDLLCSYAIARYLMNLGDLSTVGPTEGKRSLLIERGASVTSQDAADTNQGLYRIGQIARNLSSITVRIFSVDHGWTMQLVDAHVHSIALYIHLTKKQ